ncbi:SKU5 similar 13 [Striga asiatica]|uniref:SKU5 similar 13 n=1 Tax=Striga asiatica TaxID=4170 RepID=A0A5A7R042_STRAF|nr:SKU5 similar 13 [Striga asiatica]
MFRQLGEFSAMSRPPTLQQCKPQQLALQWTPDESSTHQERCGESKPPSPIQVRSGKHKMEGSSAGGGGGGGGGGGNDVELLCKTLQVEHKLFYFDLKENPRGRYLKISEKTSATRSTIIVPSNGVAWFLDLFNYYVNSDEQDVFSKELQLDTKASLLHLKLIVPICTLFLLYGNFYLFTSCFNYFVIRLQVFYFDVGENRRGRFLKISEASVSRNRSTIIVPAGSSRDEGWAAFRNILAEINEASGLFILPNQHEQNSEAPDRIVGLSDDVGAGFISSHSSQRNSTADLNVDRSSDLPPSDDMGVSKVIRADQKKFFFDLGSNNRGHFLRISEVTGSDRSSIILPLSGLKQFHEMLGHFVEITKDRIEGMTGANVRTVDPPQSICCPIKKVDMNLIHGYGEMKGFTRKRLISITVLVCLAACITAEDPYLFYEWKVTYGTISPLGVPQQGILINGQFPGPKINCTSNNNIVVNVFNHLDEPFLLTWAGIQQRKNSWQDGTPGTMCPILPGTNYTYKFQVKDQIGSYLYFPTTGLQRAAGGIGVLQVHSRDLIPVPFDRPADEFAVVLGDWYNKGHKALKSILDSGRSIGRPDGIHINGKSNKVGDVVAEPLATLEPGKTYRFRVCNAGMHVSVNFRFQGHPMTLVEMEGSHTVQNVYDSLDLHVGQCLSVLVTADQAVSDYYFVVSSRFLKKPLSAVAVVRYAGASAPAAAELPPPPPESERKGIAWSMNQFRSFRWNLTASAARPNPQGSYHYGQINITRTIKIANTRATVGGKLRFGINGVSHVNTETPLKLAEYFGVADKVFEYGLVKDDASETSQQLVVAPSVVNATFRNFVEIIFENSERSIQTWNLDGYSFFAVAIEPGKWSPEKRKNYNLLDAVSRHTIQVYPNSWAAVMTTLDNAGLWNLRSEMWERTYLGQQLYVSVLSPARSLRDEYNLPPTQQLCGIVNNLPLPAPYT